MYHTRAVSIADIPYPARLTPTVAEHRWGAAAAPDPMAGAGPVALGWVYVALAWSGGGTDAGRGQAVLLSPGMVRFAELTWRCRPNARGIGEGNSSCRGHRTTSGYRATILKCHRDRDRIRLENLGIHIPRLIESESAHVSYGRHTGSHPAVPCQ